MDKVIIWVNENKEWFFSGIGVTIVTLIFAAIRCIFHLSSASFPEIQST